MPQPLTVEPALPEELVPALRLVFQYLPEKDRVARVTNALTLICQNELNPQGIILARRKSQLVGAVVCVRLAGASGLVWPPQAVSGSPRRQVEDDLLKAACTWLRQGGAKLAQAILRPDETPLAEPLERNGFLHVTTLGYLRHDLKGISGLTSSALRPPNGKGVSFVGYTHCDRGLFQQTLMGTYEGTLDCPELNGLRSVDEIMTGHRDQGKHDPDLWWLALQGRHTVGVLLLTNMPEWDALDISYLGVLPEARGHGLGRVLAAKTLCEARARQVKQVTLAVDCRNLPAWNMYQGLGFEPHDEREVYLQIWRQ
jgi:ribosomal protein S18 acetylase RimI-like enzyme